MTTAVMFATDALIRFRNGRILIHTTAGRLPAFESDSPSLIGWLCQFVKPTLIGPALAALPSADREAATPAVDYLRRSGTLVEVGAAEPATDDGSQLLSRTKNHLRLIARSCYALACDLLSFGPYAEHELHKRTGTGVERRLMALLAGIDGLRSELTTLRPAYVSGQLAALGLTRGGGEHKLHIGCGKNYLDGWINIDISPAPLSLNVLWGLPFAAGAARLIFVSHLLEHFFFPRDVKPFLAELRRVLAPGGRVRIVVPDVEQCIEAYVHNDRSFFGSRREHWPWWPEKPTRLEDFLAYAGVGPEPAYLFESHKYGYDFETLARILTDAGFIGIARSQFMGSEVAELRVDNVSEVAKAQYGDRYYSLFVEARNPN